MGRPKKLNTTTEKTTKLKAETPETVNENAIETVENVTDDVEVAEELVESIEEIDETEVPEIVESVVLVAEDDTTNETVDSTFVPVTDEEANDPKFKYVEPKIIVESVPEVVKPVRLDHLRHNSPRKNVEVASKICNTSSAGVTFSTKVAKMF
jgi:hypothetical protein